MDRPLGEALDLIADRTGLAEILSDGPHTLSRFEEACFSFELRYTVHAPVADINIASDNEHLRRAAVRVIRDLAEVCDRIDAERLSFTRGTPGEKRCGAPHNEPLTDRLATSPQSRRT
jgi:sugar phosphate isomerase/epimerase